MTGAAYEIPRFECVELLRDSQVGHLGFISDGAPLVYPVSFRFELTPGHTEPVVVIRTRAHNALSGALGAACLEVDSIDTDQHVAWSVLVRGELHRVWETAGIEPPEPWTPGRHEYLILEPTAISGRRFVATTHPSPDGGYTVEWQFAGEQHP